MGASHGNDSSNKNEHKIGEELRKDGFENDSGNKKKYEIIKELGKGAFGNINLVLNNIDNKYYALKEIKIKEEKNINEIENEINIISKFDCNNIVKYYDSYKENDKYYILMEYCNGQNLKDFIKEHNKNNELIEENIIYIIIKQICIGIKEMHKMKIIHRDLKPENIFINKNMEIKIGDFGISKQLNKEYTLTNNKFGTLDYIAPEILLEGKYNQKSDIWSLGCIIYELFHLRIYYKDKIMNNIQKINKDIYNYKYQELINLILQPNYNKRIDINEVYNILKNINNKDNKNIAKDEIYINKEDIINSFENFKRKYKNMPMNQIFGMNPNMIDNFGIPFFPPFPFPFQNQVKIQQPQQIQGENWTLIFERKYDFNKIQVYVKSDDKIMVAINK